jgi:antigen 43
VLVPVRYLLNGATIVQFHPDSVTYFHVELENAAGAAEHGILLAEGLTVESFLDTGNRSAFANGGAVVQAHPDFAAASLAIWERDACAALVTEGAELVALRSWLFARAEALGCGLTADPGLVLSIDGGQVAAHRDGEWLHLPVPAGSATLRLRSRNAVLAETLDEGTDGRRLGVGLAGLVLDGVPTLLEDRRLLAGWHQAEPGIRWTAGDAQIDVRGLRSLALAVLPAARYWITPVGTTRPGRSMRQLKSFG